MDKFVIVVQYCNREKPMNPVEVYYVKEMSDFYTIDDAAEASYGSNVALTKDVNQAKKFAKEEGLLEYIEQNRDIISPKFLRSRIPVVGLGYKKIS